jgi:hypothetical protein
MILTYIQMIFNEKKNGLKICKILKGKKKKIQIHQMMLMISSSR